MKQPIAFLFLLFITLLSCKKSDPDPVEPVEPSGPTTVFYAGAWHNTHHQTTTNPVYTATLTSNSFADTLTVITDLQSDRITFEPGILYPSNTFSIQSDHFYVRGVGASNAMYRLNTGQDSLFADERHYLGSSFGSSETRNKFVGKRIN